MSDFYSVLAAHYDELFGCDDATVAFLSEEGAVAGARVLDVACGTGACTRALLDRRVDAYGTDLSSRMIELAKEKAHDAGIDQSRFSVADMLETAAHPCVPFGLVFCIGNSIAHLDSLDDVGRFVRAAATALGAEDGRLVLQYVDVEALGVGETFELPDLTGQAAAMRRAYHRESTSRIRFDAELTVRGEATQTISQRLLVIPTDELSRLVKQAGFSSLAVHGGFDRAPGDRGRWVRVVVAALS